MDFLAIFPDHHLAGRPPGRQGPVQQTQGSENNTVEQNWFRDGQGRRALSFRLLASRGGDNTPQIPVRAPFSVSNAVDPHDVKEPQHRRGLSPWWHRKRAEATGRSETHTFVRVGRRWE